MKNKFILQLSINQNILKRYVDALSKTGIKYDFFSIYSDSEVVGNLPSDFTDNNYITFGSIKALRISKNLSIENFENEKLYNRLSHTYKTSFFYKKKDNFDQKEYKNLNLPLLNGKADFFILNDGLNKVYKQDMFIKPSSDLKAYLGGIIPKGMSVGNFMAKNIELVPSLLKEPSLVSKLKDIHSEYRFFVIGNDVITGSRYMLDKKISESIDIPEGVKNKADELSKKYHPDVAYTLDLALLTSGDIEIVEYNCLNVSGPYLAHLEDLSYLLYEQFINPG